MLRYLDGQDNEPDSNPQNQTDAAMPEGESEAIELPFIDEDKDALIAFDDSEHGMLDASGKPATRMNRYLCSRQKIVGLEHRIGYLERIVKVSQMLNSTLSPGTPAANYRSVSHRTDQYRRMFDNAH